MNGNQRDDIVAATDLRALASELVGEPVGQGRAAKWHCPSPTHADTDPSMSIYDTPKGSRWHCFGCGAGGTCLDLVMDARAVGFTDALAVLAARAGITLTRSTPATQPGAARARSTPPTPSPLASRPSRATPPPPAPRVEPKVSSVIERYVARTVAQLWSPAGRRARDWLAQRGLVDEQVLRRNRVGYDPGPRRLARPAGLPRKGPGVVFPALDSDGHANFFQLRYLAPPPQVGKYANPTSQLAPNPRVAFIHPAADPLAGDTLVVTEGVPDALTIAHVGFAAAAVLGTSTPDATMADRIGRARPDGVIIVAFDADDAGRHGARRLCPLLADSTNADILNLTPPGAHGDLNAWWHADPTRLARALAALARPGPSLHRDRLQRDHGSPASLALAR